MTLTDDERAYRRMQDKYSEEIRQAIESHVPTRTVVSEAVEPFVDRLAQGLSSIRVLERYAQHEWLSSGLAILRGMYDAHLQLLYMLHDPQQAEQLAQDFIDFAVIEQLDDSQRLKDRLPLVHRILTANDQYYAGIGSRAKEIARVGHRFQSNRAKSSKVKRFRKRWYAGDLQRLAKKVKLEREYEHYQNVLSSSMHATPKGVYSQLGFKTKDHVLFLGWTIYFRALGRIARHFDVPISRELAEIVDPALKDHMEEITIQMLRKIGVPIPSEQ